jgi:predicted RNase H-like nuclease
MSVTHVAVGVDAAPDGWVAVRMHDHEYARIDRYADDDAADSAFRDLWADHRDADVVLVDVPIGLPEDMAARAPEREARNRLGPRSASVFNVPIRPILNVDSYADANERQKQREQDGRGLMKQTYNILPRIREVDEILGASEVDATQRVVREAHPEVCFRALNDGTPMAYSKTAQPAAAHWERVGVLASVHANDPVHDDEDAFHDALATAGGELLDWDAPALSNDDLLDAFALAVTGSPLTGELRTLPDEPAEDTEGRRMEMVYATTP